jgi:hypothetical protein
MAKVLHPAWTFPDWHIRATPTDHHVVIAWGLVKILASDDPREARPRHIPYSVDPRPDHDAVVSAAILAAGPFYEPAQAIAIGSPPLDDIGAGESNAHQT